MTNTLAVCGVEETALHDNARYEKDPVGHEQILPIKASGASFDEKGNISLGSLEVDGWAVGWETENFDLSLFDFGHAEVSAKVGVDGYEYNAMASIWSPSLSFEWFDFDIEIGAEVGALGIKNGRTTDSITLGFAAVFGGMIKISW